MSANAWWLSDPNERFWLELSDRMDDLGKDLRAPAEDGSGRDNWRYSLFKLAAVGDVVYHYHTPTDAIVGMSEVAGPPFDADIVWAARGTVARGKGEVPHLRKGYRVPLRGFKQLAEPLTLARLRENRADLEAITARAYAAYGKPLYFPFELSKRPVRPLQGYAFKLPASFVTHLLNPDVVVPPLLEEVNQDSTRQGKKGQGYATSKEHREVVEQHAMAHAKAFFKGKGYRIKDVHTTNSYDLQVERDAEVLHVEVKGCTAPRGAVFLTRNEVELARKYPERAVLYVVHSIRLNRTEGALLASGGTRVVYQPWAIDSGILEPTAFKYTPPSGLKKGK